VPAKAKRTGNPFQWGETGPFRFSPRFSRAASETPGNFLSVLTSEDIELAAG